MSSIQWHLQGFITDMEAANNFACIGTDYEWLGDDSDLRVFLIKCQSCPNPDAIDLIKQVFQESELINLELDILACTDCRLKADMQIEARNLKWELVASVICHYRSEFASDIAA